MKGFAFAALLGGRLRERVDEIEAEASEEHLLQETRRFPLALARRLGDIAGFLLGGVAVRVLRHWRSLRAKGRGRDRAAGGGSGPPLLAIYSPPAPSGMLRVSPPAGPVASFQMTIDAPTTAMIAKANHWMA